MIYGSNQDVQKNDEKAVKWYTKAASQGHSESQFALGWMYYHGRGVAQNLDKAIEWFREAANQRPTEIGKDIRSMKIM